MTFQRALRTLGWNRSSYYLLSAFILTLFLLGYVWWPLAAEYLALIPWGGEWWRYLDYLLINIFLFMSFAIMAKADIREDSKMIFVGLVGGLVIESWGTQTEIWTYYTLERPPLWIIPAWPIAGLTIDRIVRFLRRFTRRLRADSSPVVQKAWTVLYWLVFLAYYAVMVDYTSPTIDKSFTWIALGLVAFFILTPTDERIAVLTFAAGAGLGYYLELWGTTREAWTYYTLEQPPLFAVLSHGIAAVAFWRCVLLVEKAGLYLKKIVRGHVRAYQ